MCAFGCGGPSLNKLDRVRRIDRNTGADRGEEWISDAR